MTQVEIALNYARKGIRVFPCGKNKAPVKACSNGFIDATTSAVQIKKWWKNNPNALIGAPNDQFTVIDDDSLKGDALTQNIGTQIIERMKEMELISDRCMIVDSLNKGRHYYFKKTANARREIGCLPAIDLLANGGYTLLPDFKNYLPINTDAPWEALKRVPLFDTVLFSEIVLEFEDLTLAMKELKSASKKTVQPKKPKVDEKVVGNPINYKTSEYTFDEEEYIYDKKDSYIDIDYGYSLLGEGGRLYIDRGTLTTDKILTLYYNWEIQKKLASYLGAVVPEVGGRSKAYKSLLPNHTDRKPSMATRWSRDKSHILIRDFSNHYKTKMVNTDYSVVQLFATIRHKTWAGKIGANQFNMWFMLLLYEAGLIEIPIYEYEESLDGLTATQKRIAQGFALLVSFKSLYNKNDMKGSIFAGKFLSGWCSTTPATGSDAKKKMISLGLIKVIGTHNGGKGDFYNTDVYSMIAKPTDDDEMLEKLWSEGRVDSDKYIEHDSRIAPTEEGITKE